MKKTTSFHIAQNLKIALWAFGFLFLVMFLSYLFWYA
jgi:hypothetical protein